MSLPKTLADLVIRSSQHDELKGFIDSHFFLEGDVEDKLNQTLVIAVGQSEIRVSGEGIRISYGGLQETYIELTANKQIILSNQFDRILVDDLLRMRDLFFRESNPPSGGGGGGTPTSVIMPPEFSVSGNGTSSVTVSKTNQNSNLIYGTGNVANSQPSFIGLNYFHVSSLVGSVANTLASGNDTRIVNAIDTSTAQSIALNSISATSPINFSSSSGVISARVASSSQSGVISSADWSTFNGKQNSNTRLSQLSALSSITGNAIGWDASGNIVNLSVTGAITTVFGRVGTITAQASDYSSFYTSSSDAQSIARNSLAGIVPINVNASTGEISISVATTSVNGALSSTDKTKLNGIATNATANSSDASLRDRTTHTGTQPTSTISDIGTIATQNANAINITGGNINGTAIGQTTIANANFRNVAIGFATTTYNPKLSITQATAGNAILEMNAPVNQAAASFLLRNSSGNALIAFRGGSSTVSNGSSVTFPSGGAIALGDGSGTPVNVVGLRRTGWSTPPTTGSAIANRTQLQATNLSTTYSNTATNTAINAVAARVNALIDDLMYHGMIGN